MPSSATMRYGLGIDLGTTKTAAAVRVDGRVEVVRLGGRRAEIPSLVFVTGEGALLIGEPAERRGRAEPGRLAREFKRRIGDPVPILVGGVPFSAHALTGKLLRHVLDTVTRLRGGPPAAVTITYPANWGPYKREQLEQAIKIADAGDVVLRSEPEAAALQHATARRIAPGETVAVYDLGGGTFDVAVLRRESDGFVLLGEPEGIEQLGGADFDEAVFGHVIGALDGRADGLDPTDDEVLAALSRLRRDCVEAKESLSFDTETTIPVALPGRHTRVRLNRSEFESMIAPALADTIAATRRALRTAGVTPAELSAVLLAGGSSRIPLVAQSLSTEFEVPVVADPHPEHSIAMGAATVTGVDDTMVDLAVATGPAVASVPSAPPPVAFTRGAASVPGTAPAPLRGTAPAPLPATGFAAPPAGDPVPSSPPPAGPDPARRDRRRPLIAGAVAVVLLAGGIAVALAVTRGGDRHRTAAAQGGPPASAHAAAPLPFPTDTMLVRVDTGGATFPARRSTVYLLKPGSDERTALPGSVVGDVLPKWSHDRRRIALTHVADDGTSAIYVMNADGSDRHVAVRNGGGRPAWSVDGKRIGFVKKVDGVAQLFTVTLATGRQTQLTHSSDVKDDPVWTPDGKSILYWVVRGGGLRQIYELNVADPREPGRRITGADAGSANDPAPSPDGKRVLYTREDGEGDTATFDIWSIGIDGTDPHRVTTSAEREMDPTWAPDGTWFAFIRGDLDRPRVVIARADGTDERTLTRGAAREGHPCWF